MRGKGFPKNKSAGSYQCMPGGSAVCLSIRIYRISETEGKSFRPHQIEETSEKTDGCSGYPSCGQCDGKRLQHWYLEENTSRQYHKKWRDCP